MDEFFNQVAWAARAGAYFLALAGALVIPDLCAALESADGQTDRWKYADWFDRHVAPLHAYGSGPPMLDGATCYRFRCSLLHQGTTQHPASRYSRILFVEPVASGTNVFHMNVLNDALNIDAGVFCIEMVECALRWREGVVGTEPYETNLTKFVTRYPDGLRPYIGGVPVIS